MDTTSSGLWRHWIQGGREACAAFGQRPRLAIAVLWAVAAPANAHVRWFTTVADPRDRPCRRSRCFLSPLFLALLVLALAAVAAIHRVDVAAALAATAHTLGGPTRRADDRTGRSVLRVGVALYFVSIAGTSATRPSSSRPN
jgi:hypothetical protein